MSNTSLRPKIGVMGSSLAEHETNPPDLIAVARQLGQVIAEHQCVLLTGATTGLPDMVSRAARSSGGLTIGISPAISREEHVTKYLLPDDGVDVLIYTGFGLKGRNVINVRTSDIVIILGGGIGTLNEFTIAYDEGKVIGVLEGTGGVADRVEMIASLSSKRDSPEMVFDANPASLVRACLLALTRRG